LPKDRVQEKTITKTKQGAIFRACFVLLCLQE
jgi:hypothetical protein